MRHVPQTDLLHARAVQIPSSRDPITDDLRAFALELGVAGATAMSKDELVESLRQVYVLRSVLDGAQRRDHAS